MPRAILTFTFVLAAAMTAGSARLHACSCGGPPRGSAATCQAEWEADTIFVGEVLAIEQMKEPVIFASRRVTLAVSESFKGADARVIHVLTGSGGGDCGVRFDTGTNYLVFARGDAATGLLSTSLCSRTMPLSWAGSDLKLLRRPARSLKEPALIHGRVMRSDFQSSKTPRVHEPFAGAAVRIIGQAVTLDTRTSSDGRFEYKVPVGRYRLTVDAGDRFYAQPDASAGIDVRVTDATPCVPIEIELRSNGRIRGRLVDRGGQGIPFLSVDLAPDRRSGPFPRVTTDADGRFAFERLAPGDYQFGLTLRYYPRGRGVDFGIALRPDRFDVRLDTNIDVGDIRLPDGVEVRPITGIVVNDSGAPVSGVEVRVQTPGRDFGVSSKPVSTDANGGFLISVVAGREHELVAELWATSGGRPVYRTGRSAVFDAVASPQPFTVVLK